MAKVMIISLCLHGLALLIVTWFDITDLIEELKSDMHQLRMVTSQLADGPTRRRQLTDI